jgi:hypothetical protein
MAQGIVDVRPLLAYTYYRRLRYLRSGGQMPRGMTGAFTCVYIILLTTVWLSGLGALTSGASTG